MYPAWIPPFTRRASQYAQTQTQNQGGAAGNATTAGGGVKEGGVMEGVTLTTKRRRWGRFIGLRGCESPEGVDEEEQQESLVDRMEREWRRAMERMREEEMMREKSWRGRW